MSPRKNIPHLGSSRLTTFIFFALVLLNGCGSPERSHEKELSDYEKGITALEMFDYNEAYNWLQKVQPNLSKSDENWLEATYALAIASWHRPPPQPENIEQATELFNELAKSDIPEHWKDRAKLSLARIYEVSDYPNDIVDLDAARKIYEDIQNAHPQGELGYQATLRLAQTYVQQLDDASIQKGIDLVGELIDSDPNDPWAAVAWQYIGDLYYLDQHDVSSALEAYQITERMGFPNESRSDAYLWLMAEWSQELGKEEEAVRLWTRIVEDFPRSPYGTLSRDYVREYAKQHPEKGITPPELQTW